jgi:hypothetical protein
MRLGYGCFYDYFATDHLLFYAGIMMMVSIIMEEEKNYQDFSFIVKDYLFLKYNGYYLRSIVCHGGAFYLVIQI